MKTWTGKTRWTVAVLAVVAALVAALVAQLRDDPATTVTTQTAADREHRDADTPAALAGPRAVRTCRRVPPLRVVRVQRLCAVWRWNARPTDQPSTSLGAGRTPSGPQLVGVLVRAVHARTARDGRVSTTGRARRDGGDGAPRRERDGGVAAVGGARCSAADAAGRSRLVAAALRVANVMPATVVLGRTVALRRRCRGLSKVPTRSRR